LVKRLKSKKGIGTALGSIFFIIIAVTSIAAIVTISSYETRYQEVKETMVKWNSDHLSENLEIKDALPSSNPNYDYYLLINNIGGVTVNIARIYVHDVNASTFEIFDLETGIGTGFANSTINTGKSHHKLMINATALDNNHIYEFTLATDRGRQFSYIKEPPEEEGDYTEIYPIVIVADHYNFQYTAGTMTEFEQAYVKLKGTDRTLYRVKLNNTTNKRIYFWDNCTMLQMQGAVGQVVERYIVSDTSTSNPDNLVTFSSQYMDPGNAIYVYFAATAPSGNIWQTEPNNKDYYVIGFLLCFIYEGETITRNISLPCLMQELE
jgi:hypothetical protein